MKRQTENPLRLVCLAVFAVLGAIASVPDEAQAQNSDAHRVYNACYVPRTGAVYIVTDTLGVCRSDRHVAFSFTYTDAHSLDADDGDPVDAVYVDHNGRVSTGYVMADSIELIRVVADTVWSRGILIGDTYADVRNWVTTPLVHADSIKASLFVATDSVHVTGDVEVAGTVIAGAFRGDGSGLTNVVFDGDLGYEVVWVTEVSDHTGGPYPSGDWTKSDELTLIQLDAACPDGKRPVSWGLEEAKVNPEPVCRGPIFHVERVQHLGDKYTIYVRADHVAGTKWDCCGDLGACDVNYLNWQATVWVTCINEP